MRHSGELKPEYVKELRRYTFPEIAAEAARHHGMGASCGAVTSLILDWMIKVRIPELQRAECVDKTVKFFLKEYYKAWDVEKAARAKDKHRRPPTDRPVCNERRPDSWKQRSAVLDLDWDYASLRAEPKAAAYA